MAIIPLIVGLVFTGIGAYLLYDTYTFRLIARQTLGRVKGYESHVSRSNKGGRRTMYTPVVEFDSAGELYRFKASVSSSHMAYPIGDNVPVLFRPEDPHDARIRSNSRYGMGGIFGVLGLGALGIGISQFDTSPMSLMLAAGVLAALGFKALKFKQKISEHGNLGLAGAGGPDPQAADTGMSALYGAESQNYQPSANFIDTPEKQRQAKRIPAWLASLLLLLGIGMLLGSAYWADQTRDFLDNAASTQGEIVSRESSYSDGTTTWYPVIRYRLADSGESITFRHKTGSSHPGWRVGQTVTVLYDPANPRDAIKDDGWMNWLGPMIVAGTGLCLILVGAVSWRKTRVRA